MTPTERYRSRSPSYLTTADAAEVLGITREHVSTWVRQGLIPADRVTKLPTATLIHMSPDELMAIERPKPGYLAAHQARRDAPRKGKKCKST